MRTILATLCAVILLPAAALADPLPSWNDTEAKARIIAFVEAVTDPQSDDYVTPPARVATFDNDGTLWSEQPAYFQLIFALDELRRLAAEDPSILTSDTLKAAAEGDLEAAFAGGKESLLEIGMVAHSGVDTEEFDRRVHAWVESARHPQTGLAYTDMTYQPMIELLRYLRDEGFSVWIVTGGGVQFVRAFSEDSYGVPPEKVVGTMGASRYEVIDGTPRIMKDPTIFFIDDKAGKPLGIDRGIGRRPIIAVGNSDGDFEMLEYSTAGEGPRLGILIRHTDAAREYAYDRDGPIGKLVRGLDEGPERGWLIVDMAQDWSRIWSGAVHDRTAVPQ